MLQLRTQRRRLPNRHQKPSRHRRNNRARTHTSTHLPRPRLPRLRQHPRPPQTNQPLQPRTHPPNPDPNRHQQHRQMPLTRRHHRYRSLQVDEDVGKKIHPGVIFFLTLNVNIYLVTHRAGFCQADERARQAVLFVNKKNQKNFLSIPCRWCANSLQSPANRDQNFRPNHRTTCKPVTARRSRGSPGHPQVRRATSAKRPRQQSLHSCNPVGRISPCVIRHLNTRTEDCG